jgi:hypothetical protein
MSRIGCLVLALLVLGAAEAPAPDELLRTADRVRQPLEEGVVRIRAEVHGEEKTVAESLLDVYVRGTDRVLCAFREGPQQGRKILVVGERVWLLVPGAAHPIPISANQRLLGGLAVADVARLRLADHFTGRLRGEQETVDQAPCRIVDLDRRSSKAPYASGTLWVGVADGLPRRLRLALPSGKEAKLIRFTDYMTWEQHTVLKRMTVEHRLRVEHGATTTLEFLSYTAQPLAPDFFDPEKARML